VKIVIELDDALIDEVEFRCPDLSWSELVTDALTYAMTMADAEKQHDEPSDTT
jgi:hypothetical protein